MYDALVASADYLSKNAKNPKQVLLVVTDGEDNASTASLEQAIRRIQDFDGPVIYCIGLLFGEDTDKRESRHAKRVLETLAEQTGGWRTSAVVEGSRSNLGRGGAGYPDAVQHCVPSTNPPTNGGYRQVHVDAKAKGYGKLQVRTRTGYYPRVGGGANAEAGLAAGAVRK